MSLSEIPKRLAVILTLQVGACIYCIFAVGAMLKARKLAGSDVFLGAAPALPLAIKNWGWLLLALPCAWFFVHVRGWLRNGADFGLLRNVVLSGLAVLGFIVWLAFVGSAQAMGAGSLVQVK